MRTSLIPLRRHLRAALQKQKEVLGYNLAALQFMKRKVDADRTAEFYEQEMDALFAAVVSCLFPFHVNRCLRGTFH